jgi:hypothetical protein
MDTHLAKVEIPPIIRTGADNACSGGADRLVGRIEAEQTLLPAIVAQADEKDNASGDGVYRTSHSVSS